MFTPSRTLTAAQKETLFCTLTAFILDGCKAEDVTKGLYHRLSTMFGLSAHGGRASFIAAHFAGPAERQAFIARILAWPCSGDPAASCSDVERELLSWLEANRSDVAEGIAAPR